MGAGAAFLDYDNDGWQDILLVNSMDWPENKGRRKTSSALYHNNSDGTFPTSPARRASPSKSTAWAAPSATTTTTATSTSTSPQSAPTICSAISAAANFTT